MTQIIKTNWPLLVLAVLAAAIMAVIVDMKRNELPKIREEMRLEKLRKSQEKLMNESNVVHQAKP